MVYNAMKLFMEVNPSLFDECSNAYRDDEDLVIERQRDRDARWDRLKQMAIERQNGTGDNKIILGRAPTTSNARSPNATDGTDPFGHNGRDFESLRIQEDSTPIRGAVR